MTRTATSPTNHFGRRGDPARQRVVMKFGGTSVRDAPAILRVCQIVRRELRQQLVVVSALAGVTDQLVDLATRAGAGESPARGEIVDAMRLRYLNLVTELVSAREQDAVARAIDESCRELRAIVHAVAVLQELSPRSVDAIAGFGEAMSRRLVAAALVSSGVAAEPVDATRVLVTNGSHGRALPDMEATKTRVHDVVSPILEAGSTAVVGGFVGATSEGVVTTLGRGGSDYSAAIFGAVLDVDEIQILTDVDGMLTADPKIVDDARLVRALSFGEASELAYFGARVLHPATIQSAVAQNIPVRIANAQRPDGQERRSPPSQVAAVPQSPPWHPRVD